MISSQLISGTFVQIDHWSDKEGARFQEDLRKFDCDDWCETIDDMAAVGIDTIVFQQCIDNRNGWDDTRSYYTSKTRRKPAWLAARGDLFDAAVKQATKRGMTIIYGVGSMYSVNPYLHTQAVIEQASITASELLELYGDLPSFGGWYWTYEFPPCSVSGRDSLKKIVPALRAIKDCNIMIAPNLDRMMTPSLLEDVDADIVAYQDNVGLGAPPDWLGRSVRFNRADTLNALPFFYRQLRYYHDAWQPDDKKEINYWNYYRRPRGRVALWNDLEIWDFDLNASLIPAEITRIASQLELSAPYVDKQIIYQYTGLMQNPRRRHRAGGERAETLFEEYQRYRQHVLDGTTSRFPQYYREFMRDFFNGLAR